MIGLQSFHDLAKDTQPEPSMRGHDDANRCPLDAIKLTTNKEDKKANSKCIQDFFAHMRHDQLRTVWAGVQIKERCG